MYPLEKYRFYTNGKKVFAVSTYAGKEVRGVASCHPNDTFDLQYGKALAAARCEAKVAQKRLKRAQQKKSEALNIALAAEEHYTRMQSYYNDAYKAKRLADLSLSMFDDPEKE